jgi:hypothetical protein
MQEIGTSLVGLFLSGLLCLSVTYVLAAAYTHESLFSECHITLRLEQSVGMKTF